MKVHYAKPYLTIDKQVDLLASRGLRIKDRSVARDLLTGVNYYRLTGYAIPFSIDREHFKKGATLSDLIAVYLFDRKARDILSEALEAIELGFRAAFCRAFAEGLGPLCYRDAANFKSVQTFKGTLARIDAEIIRSNEPYIQHFRANYLADEIPIWAAVEVCSFGTLTKLYSNLKKPYQQKIARVYSIKHDILDSYLHHLVVMRNCCAHHARLFDRKFYGYRPLNEWRNTPTATLDTRTFFAQLLLVYRMLRPLPSVCFDRTRWRRVVYRLLRDTPNCSVFDMDRIMDIPADYRKKFLWQ